MKSAGKIVLFIALLLAVPDIKTVHHEEKYEVLYRVTYDNGSTYDRWETVGKEEWEEAGNGQGQNGSAVVRGLPPL